MTYYHGLDEPSKEHGRRRDVARYPVTLPNDSELQEGDLYFMRRSGGADRFFVENENGDLQAVTHVYGLYGWRRYDEAAGNLAIKLNNASESLIYAARRAIESALSNTPLGRVVGRDALRPMVDAVCMQIGLGDGWDDETATLTISTDPMEGVRQAVLDLLNFAPETGYPDEIGEIGAEYDGVGFAEDADHYIDHVNGRGDGFGGEGSGSPLPLLSQPVYYAVLGGKHDGRSMNSRIEKLKKLVGIED